MKRHSYPSDLSDEQCKRIERLLPAPKPGGRPAKHDRLAILNAILYLVRTAAVREDIPENPVRKSGVLNIIELFADG
jgi:transposase